VYDLSRYDNLFPPSAWLVVIGLVLLFSCHLMVLYFEYEIRDAVRRAHRSSRYADSRYIAQDDRRRCQGWRNGRALSGAAILFGMVGWVISL